MKTDNFPAPALSASRLVLITGLATLLVFTACSDGKSQEENFAAALRTVEAEVRPAAARWATDVASELNAQIQTAGEIDLGRVLMVAERTGEPLAKTACKTVAENDALANSQDNADAAFRELDALIDRELMVAIGKHPRVIYDMKVQWPTRWLLDPSKQPDASVPMPELDPLWLRGFLQPEFLSDDGSVRLPDQGDAEYRTLRAWMLQDDSKLAERASFLAGSVTDDIRQCIRDARA